MSARLWLSWVILATALLGLSSYEAPPAPSRAFRVAADTDTTAPKRALVMGDSLMQREENGEVVQFYVGHVEGQQDSTTLFADWAKRFVAREQVLLTGDVLIVDQGDSLFADTVFYDERNKIGRARGHVRLSDGEVVARAPSGLYFIDEKKARFSEGVTLNDSTAEITSRTGLYWTEEKRAELEGDVRLQAERTYMEADSLTYFRETEISIARGTVFIERLGGEADADSTIRTLLFSQWAYNDQQAGLSCIRGRPLLVQLRQDSTGAEVDTLVIQALRLEALEQDSVRRLVAVDSVQVWQADLAAVADSVVYERLTPPADTLRADTLAAERSEETRLYRGPILWVGEAQISGDTIRVKGQGNQIDSLFVRQRAFVAQRDSVTGRIHQVKGQHLLGLFYGDSTRTFIAGPNAETIYFRHDDEDRPDGGLQVSGDQAIFRFRGEEPEEILFPGEPQGAYYSESLLPNPFQLDGFRWLPERRPAKAALLRDERVLQRLAFYATLGAQRPATNAEEEPAAEAEPAKEASSSNQHQRP